jgi:hypothetical protein
MIAAGFSPADAHASLLFLFSQTLRSFQHDFSALLQSSISCNPGLIALEVASFTLGRTGGSFVIGGETYLEQDAKSD